MWPVILIPTAKVRPPGAGSVSVATREEQSRPQRENPASNFGINRRYARRAGGEPFSASLQYPMASLLRVDAAGQDCPILSDNVCPVVASKQVMNTQYSGGGCGGIDRHAALRILRIRHRGDQAQGAGLGPTLERRQRRNRFRIAREPFIPGQASIDNNAA